MRGRILGLIGTALSGLAAATMPASNHHAGRTRRPVGYRGGGGYRFRPHNGEREIARRLRQQARDAERQRQRALKRDGVIMAGQVGISRRGRLIYAPR